MVASQSLAQMVLLLCPLSAQAQTGPQSVDGKLDASDTEVAASLASSSQRELVIGRGPYFYWNEMPTPAAPDGSDTYTAVVGDVITFRYNHDNNVYLMATEADWESCDFGNATLVGDQTMDNAPQDFSSVGLTMCIGRCSNSQGRYIFRATDINSVVATIALSGRSSRSK